MLKGVRAGSPGKSAWGQKESSRRMNALLADRFRALQAELTQIREAASMIDFYHDGPWSKWKYVLRAIGKLRSIAASEKVILELELKPCESEFPLRDHLPPDQELAMETRVRESVDQFLAAPPQLDRNALATWLREFEDLKDAQNRKSAVWCFAGAQRIELFAALAKAILAPTGFENHIRRAFEWMAWHNSDCASHFREQLDSLFASSESTHDVPGGIDELRIPPRTQRRFDFGDD